MSVQGDGSSWTRSCIILSIVCTQMHFCRWELLEANIVTFSYCDLDKRFSESADKCKMVGIEERIWKSDMQNKTLACIVQIKIS